MVLIWETVAGCFAIASVVISLVGITNHLQNFTKPYLQRYIVRILLMVPIYSMNAWIAMIWPVGIYLDSLRECYESFVIYSFMKYLLNFLKYDTNLQQYIDFKPGPENFFPFCCFPVCVGGREFMLKCKHGILQYVLVRPLTSLIAFISQIFGIYGEGALNPFSGYTYPLLIILNNLSQLIAMYSLVIFYTGYRHELRPMKPIGKFLSIKLVIFFSFFQQVLIAGLLRLSFFYDLASSLFPNVTDKVSLAKKLQELLICFDMLLAAIGHLFAFPHKPFAEQSGLTLINDSLAQNIGSSSASCLAAAEACQTSAVNNNIEHDDDDDDNNAGCCSAIWSLFDFRDERADFTETFSDASERMRLLFNREKKLPNVVSRQPTRRSGQTNARITTTTNTTTNTNTNDEHRNRKANAGS